MKLITFLLSRRPSLMLRRTKNLATSQTVKKRFNYFRLSTLLILNFGLLTQAYSQVTGPGSAWLDVRKITLSAATPISNFQVKVSLTTGQYTNMNASGNDLRFYDINNNPCNYWIETWNTSGASTIWVKVPVSSTTILFMYYGNSTAVAASNGANTFDFFDDFTGSTLAANWQQSISGGSLTVSGGVATLASSSTSGSNYITSAFTPASTSFTLETKHQEPKYYRNRFYASTSAFGANPFGFDNGYFNSGVAGAYTSALIFWNGSFQTGTTVTAGINYLTQWQITDGSGATYAMNTYTYSTMALIKSNSAANTATPVRYITIGVTEAASTSTAVDWVRVRKSNSSFTDPTATVGSQVANISASISSQTNVLCFGNATGSAQIIVSGGSTPYHYSWNTSPIQTTQTATSLAAGNYIATVSDNVGLTTTVSVTITAPSSAVTTTVASQSNPACFSTNTGQIIISGVGGTGTYTYSINNGTSYQSSNIFNNLSAGSYKIRVKDSNGCESKSVL